MAKCATRSELGFGSNLKTTQCQLLVTNIFREAENVALRLVQFVDETGCRRVAIASNDRRFLTLVDNFEHVYSMALTAIHRGESLSSLAQSNASTEKVDYDRVVAERRLLPPIDHPDPAHCVVSLTGLTHVGSAKARDEMHSAVVAPETLTDSIRMFQLGIARGKPASGSIGAQPEWAYKGDGRCLVPPEQELTQPSFADDGGEEAEIAGLYVIDDAGLPWRVGFALGNEFSDHVLEKKNYLYLAHSKLRQCSVGPELLLGQLPALVSGTASILRNNATVWSGPFESGEDNMCHSIANLEHHHFKYELFRRPGDVHVHFLGANRVSFASNVRTQSGDIFEINAPAFGRPLRNTLRIARVDKPIQVKAL